jgi:hypothetical protein
MPPSYRANWLADNFTPLPVDVARAMEARNGLPFEVSLVVETPVTRDQDHRSKWGDVHTELQQEGALPLHAVEHPLVPPQMDKQIQLPIAPSNRARIK